MRRLLSQISFVMVTNLLPKKSYKNATWIGFPMRKNICSFISSFHFCSITLVGWVSWAKRTTLGASFDLKYSNKLIPFLVNLSPLTLFDMKLKLTAGIACIYIRLYMYKYKVMYTFSWQFKHKSRKTRFEENSIAWHYKRMYKMYMYKFSFRSNVLAVLKVHCQSNSIFSGNSETNTFENISPKNNTSVTEAGLHPSRHPRQILATLVISKK